MFRIAINIIVFLLSVSVANAQPSAWNTSFPEGTEIIEFGAGEKDVYGLYLAKSSTQRFSAKFPGPYHEWKSVIVGQEDPTYSIGSVMENGTRYLITEFNIRVSTSARKRNGFIKQLFKNQRTNSRRSISQNGTKGIEVRINTKTSSTISRFLFTRDNVYQLSVEFPKSSTASYYKSAYAFFDTFSFS